MTLAILVTLISLASVSVEAACPAGSVTYQQSISLALSDYVSRPQAVDMNTRGGRLTLSVTNSIHADDSASIAIRSTYANVRNGPGPEVRTTTYNVVPDASCTGFAISSIAAEPAIDIGGADVSLTIAAATATRDYFRSNDVVPLNRHSGDHSVRVHTPTICDDGKTANVNLVRIGHDTTGLVYRTTTYLIELASASVVKSGVRAGRLLQSLCP
ncbi:hypothetical protein BH10BDE1_BH10BDE1_23150 [soil metagenome]